MQNEIYKREYTKEFVSRWDALIGWDGRSEAENGFFENLLNRHNCKKVADIATGTGFHAIKLANAGFEMTATDGSANMVRKTEENAASMDVALADSRVAEWGELDQVFAPNSFDALLCLGNAFTHLFEEEARRKSLDSMLKVLKPGGLVVIDHRNYDKILDQGYSSKHQFYYCGEGVDAKPVKIQNDMVRFEYSYDDGNKFHLTMFPLRQHYMSKLLEEAGFSNIKRHGDFSANFDADEVDFIQQVAFKPRN